MFRGTPPHPGPKARGSGEGAVPLPWLELATAVDHWSYARPLVCEGPGVLRGSLPSLVTDDLRAMFLLVLLGSALTPLWDGGR